MPRATSIGAIILILFLSSCGGGGGGGDTSQGNGGPSIATVSAASSITQDGTTLNGSVTPNGLATQAWFEYGTGASLSTYASTAMQSVGDGLGAVAIIQTVSGCAGGTVYYFRVCGINAKGTTKSTITSFTTSSPGAAPMVDTLAATLVAATSATLNGNVTPNGLETTAWFEGGTDAALSTYSTTLAQSVGSGTTSQLLSTALPGLSIGTTYYYRVAANNVLGTSNGTIVSYTPGAPPTVSTLAASSVAANSATLNGNVTPNGLETTARFEWGTDAGLATYSTTLTQSMGSGTTSVPINAELPGLSIGTTYYYRVEASNNSNTSKGAIVSFTPGAPPTVSTLPATAVLATSATLNGAVTPNGLVTMVWFEWGTDAELATYSMTLAQSEGSGTTSVPVNAALPVLSIGTTYYYRVAASNSSNTSKGAIVSFIPSAAPSVTTLTATQVVTTSVTLNGNVTPNGLTTSAWFEWGTTPASIFNRSTTQNLGSGTANISVNATLTGLIGGTTYYYRVVAQNNAGPSSGSILNLTTATPYIVSGKVILDIDIPIWSNMIPTMEECGSCHTNINWATGEGHLDIGQLNNNTCSVCHSLTWIVSYHLAVPSVAAVNISLTGENSFVALTITDSFGNYIINNVPNGSYKITPSMSRYNFTPQSIDIIINNDNYIAPDVYKTL